MRSLSRLEKPEILKKKETTWSDNFIASTKFRPDNTKYSHPEIRSQLHRISFSKCFYSEVKFASVSESQVDHYIEVEESKELAYNWDNLFLAHKDCNQGKSSNKTIPNGETLNPFLNTDSDIENHLFFEDEIIRPKDNSSIGLKTIQKYNLNKDIFNILRSKELRKFEKTLIDLLKIINDENRKLNNAEKELLNRFAQPDNSFSFMFRIKLKEHNLLINI
jgi:5-methylcytosine-specific restriction endonuclease McrA